MIWAVGCPPYWWRRFSLSLSLSTLPARIQQSEPACKPSPNRSPLCTLLTREGGPTGPCGPKREHLEQRTFLENIFNPSMCDSAVINTHTHKLVCLLLQRFTDPQLQNRLLEVKQEVTSFHVVPWWRMLFIGYNSGMMKFKEVKERNRLVPQMRLDSESTWSPKPSYMLHLLPGPLEVITMPALSQNSLWGGVVVSSWNRSWPSKSRVSVSV